MKLQRIRILWIIGIVTMALVTGAILYSQPVLAGPQITVYRSPG